MNESNSPLTAEERKELALLCEKATPEPWEIMGPYPTVTICIADPSKDDPSVGYFHYEPICTLATISNNLGRSWTPDAALIAAARTALPRALATIEGLEAALGADTVIAAPDGTPAKFIRCQESLVEGWLKAVLEREDLQAKVADLERQLAERKP